MLARHRSRRLPRRHPKVVVFPFPPPSGTTEFAKTDLVLSSGDNYLYVVFPGVTAASHIDVYSVNDDGTLTLFGSTPSTLAGGLSGLVAT
jgi:hypothetical protein